MREPIPATPRDVTTDWCNQVLAGRLGKAKVANATAEYLSTPGQTADVAGVELKFDGPTDFPSHLIAKFTASLDSTLELAESLDFYRREVSFIRPSAMRVYRSRSAITLISTPTNTVSSSCWKTFPPANHLPGPRSCITWRRPLNR